MLHRLGYGDNLALAAVLAAHEQAVAPGVWIWGGADRGQRRPRSPAKRCLQFPERSRQGVVAFAGERGLACRRAGQPSLT